MLVGMVPLPVPPVKAPSPNFCPSPFKLFACHTSGQSFKSPTLSDAAAPATPLDLITNCANSFGIHTSSKTHKIPLVNSFESMQHFSKFFPCHTSENSPVTPLVATDPKSPSRKPFVCHTSETLRGWVTSW